MVLAASKYGDADACQRDNHCQDAHPVHLLSEGDPGHQGGSQWGQRHKQLSVAGADDDITLEEAIVADDVAH